MPCRAQLGGAAAAAAPGSAAAAAESPARGAYGEVSSASCCADYQARRLNIRYRRGAAAGDNRFVHTLNATACAIPRVMLALLETHQQADGSVLLPPCLRPYMGGRERLEPRACSLRAARDAVTAPLLPETELFPVPGGTLL